MENLEQAAREMYEAIARYCFNYGAYTDFRDTITPDQIAAWRTALDDASTKQMSREQKENYAKWRTVAQMKYVECPCGCGLKGDVCAAQLKRIKQENDNLPF